MTANTMLEPEFRALAAEALDRAVAYATAEVAALDDTDVEAGIRPFLGRLGWWARTLEGRLTDRAVASARRLADSGAGSEAVDREARLAALAAGVALDALRRAVAATRELLRCRFLPLISPGWSPLLILVDRAFLALGREAAAAGVGLELPPARSVVEAARARHGGARGRRRGGKCPGIRRDPG